MEKKFLNEVLKLEETLNLKDLSKVKIRFIVADSRPGHTFDPVEAYKKGKLCDDLYYVKKQYPFKDGDIVIGFFRMDENRKDEWLLFHIGKAKIKKDFIGPGVGYKPETFKIYEKYFSNLIVKYHNTSQKLFRKAEGLIGKLEVIKEP